MAEETYLEGCFILTPNPIGDKRGHFFESYNHNYFEEITGIAVSFVQDNQSKSIKGVLRGLHFQVGEFAQAKLVRVVKGKILDVCVDLRLDSQTFGKHFSIIMDEIEHKQLYIPRGFAHGFLVLEDDTIVNYKCDNYYNKSSEKGILYKDSTLNIDWNIPEDSLILSEKDRQLPSFDSFLNGY